jgi:hypothetical protein
MLKQIVVGLDKFLHNSQVSTSKEYNPTHNTHKSRRKQKEKRVVLISNLVFGQFEYLVLSFN